MDRDGLLDTADRLWPGQSRQAVCPSALGLAAHLLPVGNGEAELGEHLFMRDRFVVLAPFVGLGHRLGFGGTERVAVLIQKYFE